jgi:spore maturation protein CgeB
MDDADRREFGSPLSFVGAGYHNRLRFFRALANQQFKIWGSGWPQTPPLGVLVQKGGQRVTSEMCVKIFNASAINLNLHSSTSHEGIVPMGDFINPRTFEIAACEAFQLVDQRSHLNDLFTEDELVTYGDLPELRAKIDHYLSNSDKRRAVARKGRNRVVAEHTYQSRMEELLSLMMCAFPQIADKAEGRRLRQQTHRDSLAELPGLATLLSQIPSVNSLDLDALCTVISHKDSDLSRTERIFLMMRDIQSACQGVGE